VATAFGSKLFNDFIIAKTVSYGFAFLDEKEFISPLIKKQETGGQTE
jgi:hypothetical protein